MITQLKIKNYALIKSLDIDFKPGFTSITGETGAGKSILLGAIGLVMGDRSDSSAILDPTEKCVIEADFYIASMGLKTAFEDRDIDYSDHCTVRREWAPNGKTRSFINESQVTVSELKWLGTQLLEIHSQHTGLLVTQNEEQMKLLDAYCGADLALAKYQKTYITINQLKTSLKSKQQALAKIRSDSDYNNYLLDELQQFAPIEGEEDQLEKDIALLSQSSELETSLSKIDAILDGGQGSLIDLIGQLKSELKGFTGLSSELNDYFERIQSMGVEAKELARDIQSAAGSYESNPEKLEQLNQRFSALQLLLRKHGCNTSMELMEKFALLQQGQVGENHLEAEITEIEEQISALFKQMELEAKDLHGMRQAAKDALSKRVVEQLHQLEMPFAQMEVLVESMGDNYNEYGNSRVAIHFSANKGQHPMPIEKVASGGEISRLNFCLRTIIAELKQLPTLIYDEADTGVSGEVASRLGYLMRKQGGKQQILAITHLPQVACSGNQQLFVYKNNEADISETQIKTLDENGRIVAIAEMLSGKNPSEAALLNAKNLLEIQST